MRVWELLPNAWANASARAGSASFRFTTYSSRSLSVARLLASAWVSQIKPVLDGDSCGSSKSQPTVHTCG